MVRLRSARLTVVLVVATVMVAIALVMVISRSGPGGPSGSARRVTTATGRAAGQPVVQNPGATQPHAVSLVSTIGPSGSSLVIRSLGVHAPLVPTGAIGPAGTAALTIPSDVRTAAWWDGTVTDGDRTIEEDAPQPGQPGVALIAGHIDSARAGPGALFDLKNITVGASVEIVDSAGHDSMWTVSGPPETTGKTALPRSLWVTTGPPKLALVTCGGPFDQTTGHYLDNVIVWATPAGK
ncbi:MAG TPA: class F sortase [Acidimicrobiales bacterium]|jgi:hypothetical protein